MKLRPDRFCNLIYTWCVDRVENRAQFDTELLAPLPGMNRRRGGRPRPSEVDAQQEGRDFMAFMGQVTTG